jgi:hypothetical protein
MTRFLSDALEAREPFFRLGLRGLEGAGHDRNTDIRFSTHVHHAAQAKMRELGLDPHDTTPEELYHLLQERLRADDAQLTKRLRTEAATHVSAEGEVVSGMVHVLKQLPDSKHCFALKNSSLRTILKKLPPKKAMKQLGYRSLDSFLKHEAPVSILAAAWLTEGASWQHRLLDHYKQLQPTDFETRSIIFTQPDSKRWRELAEATVRQKKHTILCFKELGALIFLPFPAETPSGAVTVSLSLALHELNQIRAGSTFLKLCQVRSDFGSLVKTVANSDEPQLGRRVLDQPLSWQLIQRYYALLTEQFREELFEPHIRLEDMVWHPIEQALSAIEPSLAFWKDTAHLGVLHERQPVSFNIVDVALNYCNKLPFEQRIVHYFRQSLWHELLLQYLPHETVEQTVMATLQPKLAKETILA